MTRNNNSGTLKLEYNKMTCASGPKEKKLN